MLISATDLISQSLLLFKKHWKVLLQYVGLIAIATLTITFVSEYVFPTLFKQQPTWLFVIEAIFIGLAATTLNLWFGIGLINALKQMYTGQVVTPTLQMIAQSKKLIWQALLASLLVGLMILLGGILFIIPAIIFFVWFAFSAQAVALDKSKAIDAIKQSKALVKGRFWQVLWKLVLPIIVFAFITWIIQFIFASIISYIANMVQAPEVMFIVLSIVMTIIAICVIPLTTAAQTILFLELQKHPVPEPKKLT